MLFPSLTAFWPMPSFWAFTVSSQKRKRQGKPSLYNERDLWSKTWPSLFPLKILSLSLLRFRYTLKTLDKSFESPCPSLALSIHGPHRLAQVLCFPTGDPVLCAPHLRWLVPCLACVTSMIPSPLDTFFHILFILSQLSFLVLTEERKYL